jgi:predicted O-methyltransferase YrrM
MSPLVTDDVLNADLAFAHRMITTNSFLSPARMIYRRATALLRMYKLRRMLEGGLPQPLQTPLEFLFAKGLSPEARRAVERVESIRSAVAQQMRSFEVVNPHNSDPQRTAAQIAHRSSVTFVWGTFLYLCAESFRSRTILELGSCAGISGCYLASSRYCTKFITVEGSASLAPLAKSNIERISDRGEVVNALFDDALDQILPTLGGGVDLAYIDGHHEYEATLHYFRRLQSHLNKGALVVIDDIHWSDGMWRAWQVLRGQEGVGYTIDAGRFGICLWEGDPTRPVHYDLRRYVGWPRKVNVSA